MARIHDEPGASAEAFVPWREFLGSGYTPSLILVCLGVWLHAADSLIVATMLPAIVVEIGGARLVGWSVSLYEIASVVAGTSSALLTMRYGLQRPMSLAAALFGFGCLLSAFAPTMPLVLVGRILQGAGGGGLVSMSFVAVGILFPRRYAARALAVVSTFWGMSAFLGPLIGGYFVEFATWRWGFGFFAFQAFGFAIWIAMRKDKAARHTLQAFEKPHTLEAPQTLEKHEPVEFPLKRLGLLCLAVLFISYGGVDVALIETTTFIALGLGCLLAFLWLDDHAGSNRLLPNRPFDFRGSTGSALLMILSLSVATIPIVAFGPLLITIIHNASALTAGYIVACSSVGWTLAAVLASGSPEKRDPVMITTGMILTAMSIVGFLYAVPNGPVWLIAVFAAMEGAGFGMAWTFILRRTTARAEPQEVQRVSGAIPTVQRLGYALGAAYIGIIANASDFTSMNTPSAAADGANWIFLACLPFAILGLLAMITLVRKETYPSKSIR